MIDGEIVVPKVWRSEMGGIIIFLILTFVAYSLSSYWESGAIIRGRLFTIGDTSIYLSLPWLYLIPFASLVLTYVKMYNVRYSIDKRGIETRIGILSLNQKITRVRFEDVRSAETYQSLLDRMLYIGTVKVGTAATGQTEIEFKGIDAPEEVQDLIQRERDSRQKASRRNFHHDQQKVNI